MGRGGKEVPLAGILALMVSISLALAVLLLCVEWRRVTRERVASLSLSLSLSWTVPVLLATPCPRGALGFGGPRGAEGLVGSL